MVFDMDIFGGFTQKNALLLKIPPPPHPHPKIFLKKPRREAKMGFLSEQISKIPKS
jgi:hypothetical protein